MPTPYEKIVERRFENPPNFRKYCKAQYGVRGDFVTPYNYFTVFEIVKGEVFFPFNGAWTSYDARNAPGAFIAPPSRVQAAYNRAYGKAMSMARGDTAQLGATLGEYQSSSRMIRGRAVALYKFTKSLNKRYRRVRKRRRWRGRDFADYWLEYSFGWAPMLGDIYNGLKRMLTTPKEQSFFGGASFDFDYDSGPGTLNPHHSGSYQYRVRVFGKVRITNQNAALANDLGVTNPLYIAWELAPWSFVADWLFDIGGFLSSLTDSFGREYLATGVAESQFGTRTMTWSYGLGSSTCTSLVARRGVGPLPFPLPNLAILDNVGSNLKRAVNAIALTVQLVSSGNPVRPRR